MNAFQYKHYGSPKELKLVEIKQPIPKPNEVLIKIKAISLNPADWHMLRASIWLVRLSTGLIKPKNTILGADISGYVEAIGSEVKSFKIGDKVFGRNLKGGFAEFGCIHQNRVAHMPKTFSFIDAAAIPLASITALIGLRNKGEIKREQRVLINGASGGIGTFAIQLAKYFGAQVTAVCSSKNIDLVYTLGADFVIDYTSTDFTIQNQNFDLVIDLIGNRTPKDIHQILKPKGRCVVIGFTNAKRLIDFMIRGNWKTKTTQESFIMMNAEITRKDLEYIVQLAEEGFIHPVIDKVYPFKNTQQAFKYLGSRRAKGKIVLEL